jgi:hypothetical protein
VFHFIGVIRGKRLDSAVRAELQGGVRGDLRSQEEGRSAPFGLGILLLAVSFVIIFGVRWMMDGTWWRRGVFMATVSGTHQTFRRCPAVENLDLGSPRRFGTYRPVRLRQTTTLRLIAGFLQPDGGEIRVGDKVISSPSAGAAGAVRCR